MKKQTFLIPVILITLLFLLCSCEIFYRKPPTGTMRVLVYGNDYSVDGNTGSYLVWNGENCSARKLDYTNNDAIQVGLAFKNLAIKAETGYQITYILGHNLPAGKKAELIDGNSNVIEDVSLDSFKDAVDGLRNAHVDDITIIYFSGHGFNGFDHNKVGYGTDKSESSYLVMNETSSSSVCKLYKVSDFLESVNQIPGAKVVLGDFCFSGSLVRAEYVSQTNNEYSSMNLSDLFYGNRDRICASPSLFCLSASRYFEEAYENPLYEHGYFTYALLDALGWDEINGKVKKAGAQKGGMITFLNIANYVVENDKDSGKPMFSGGSNDLVLFMF